MAWVIPGHKTKEGSLAVPAHGGKSLTPCAAIAQSLDPTVPQVALWKRGEQVRGNARVQRGTVIAIFNSNGDYAGS